jgi:MSHA biogenesis protein MshE
VAITRKVHIGKLLLEKNLLTQEQLDFAIAEQNATGKKLGQTLVDLGYVKEDKLLELLSEQLKIPYVDLKTYALNPENVQLLPEFYARHFRALVLTKENDDILVGMADPQNILAHDELIRILQSPIRVALVRERDLIRVIDAIYRHTTEITHLAEELSEELVKSDYDIEQLTTGLSQSDAPVVKLLQTIFDDAVQVNASDVHIEPAEHGLRIRHRIDGLLHEQMLKEKQVAPALTLRLKLMAGLNITEKRLPQDGRFSIRIRNQNFDIRLSTMPVQYGESVVMRLLNQSAENFGMDRVGMPDHMLALLKKIVTMPNGILLVTGPTGSGKTTTLYGILSSLNTPEKKIISVEDPVEYRLARINQVQVNSRIDLSFARVLRTVLRQDPDIIMVGELRDQETVAMAMRAAMTGHFVLSTLHTNDAISSAIRLIDMGAEGFLVATILRAVIAQRLVRRICQNCVEAHTPTPEELIWLNTVPNYSPVGKIFYTGLGCTYCHNTGYKGQIGVFEFLEMTPYLAEMLRLKDTAEFNRAARHSPHFRPLILNGLDMVDQGITTISEMIRILGETLMDTALAEPKVSVDANV